MSKLTRFLGLIILLLGTSVFVSAMEVKLEDFGAIVNDGADDSAALQSAVDTICQKGGGIILFPTGTIDIRTQITLAPSGFIGADIKLKGNHSSVIEVSVGQGNIAFYSGNLNILTFEDLAFIGKNVPRDSPDFFDARYVIVSNSNTQTNIIRCQLYGLAVPTNGAIIYLGSTDTRISDTQIDGNAAQYPDGAAVFAENSMGLTVSRTTFYDYTNFRGRYVSKTPAFTGAWIKVKGGLPHVSNGLRRILIEDSRFDEGSATAIRVEDVAWVNIIGISVNVSGSSPGRGIFLKNIEYAKIEQSWFGYTPSPRPALDFENVRAAEILSLKFGGGVYFLKQYPLPKIDIKYCRQCVARNQANTKIK